MTHPSGMHDLRASMAAAKSDKAVRCILSFATNRLESVRGICWPALEESLSKEVQDLQALARGKGFDLTKQPP
jgi:hypothetical protein